MSAPLHTYYAALHALRFSGLPGVTRAAIIHGAEAEADAALRDHTIPPGTWGHAAAVAIRAGAAAWGVSLREVV